MVSVGLQPAISAIKLPQTYALDRTATGVRLITFYSSLLQAWVKLPFLSSSQVPSTAFMAV